jgi:hypothetical protein
VQNLDNKQWELGKVEFLLNQRMVRAVDDTVDCWTDLKTKHENGFNGNQSGPTLRDAALTTAIKRLATVILQRDIWP